MKNKGFVSELYVKQIFLLLLFLLFTSVIAEAQNITDKNEKQKYKLFSSIGIFGGADLTSISGDAPEDVSYSGNIGFLGGISVEFNITEDIKLLLQPMYNVKGTKILYDIGENEPRDSLRLKFDYIRVPVLAKINAFNGVTYFLSGLDIGFLLNSVLYDIEKINGETDISEFVNEFDVAALFGFGVKFNVKSNSLYFELRYSQSLLNMSDNSINKFDSYLPTRFRLSGLQLLTGFNFNL
jgi:hypothetical protein